MANKEKDPSRKQGQQGSQSPRDQQGHRRSEQGSGGRDRMNPLRKDEEEDMPRHERERGIGSENVRNRGDERDRLRDSSRLPD